MKLGIIGGMGARAAAHFLQGVIDRTPAATDQEHIEVLLHNNSRIPDRTRAILHGAESPVPELRRSLEILTAARVDVVVMACVTSYYFYPQLQDYTDAYFPNPFGLLTAHIRDQYPTARRVGVLASTGALKAGLFHAALAGAGLAACVPDPYTQEAKFMASLYGKGGAKSGQVSPEAFALFEEALQILVRLEPDVIVGGCSEVPVLLRRTSLRLPFADLMQLMIDHVVARCCPVLSQA